MLLSSVTCSSPHPSMFRLPKCRPFFPRATTAIRCSSSSLSNSLSASTLATQFDLKTYWTTLIKEINQKLDEAIPVQYPHQIYEAMRYSVLAKGAKRSPPVMCVAACELFGGNRLAAFPTACALEMVLSLYFFIILTLFATISLVLKYLT